MVHQLIKQLHSGLKLFNNFSINIHEVHHTKKLDAPSGTAKSWSNWIGNENVNEISHDRTGDVVGDHKITLEIGDEKIAVHHEALDRKLFASGSVWAANYLLQNKDKLLLGFTILKTLLLNYSTKRNKYEY